MAEEGEEGEVEVGGGGELSGSQSPGCKRMLPSACHVQGGRVWVGRKG